MVARHPVRRVFADGFPGAGGQRFLAVFIHRHDFVAQRVFQRGGVAAVAARKGDGGRGRGRETGVQGHGFQSPGVAAAFGVAPRHLVQGVLFVGQIDHVPHLGMGQGREVFQGVGGLDGRDARNQPGGVGDAQRFFPEHQDEILGGLGIETERQQQRGAPQIVQKQRAGPPGHISVQVGDEILHTLH